MGLFNFGGNQVEKTIKKLKAKGYSDTAYRSRKCCENCMYRNSSGMCRMSGKSTIPSELCNNWFGR